MVLVLSDLEDEEVVPAVDLKRIEDKDVLHGYL